MVNIHPSVIQDRKASYLLEYWTIKEEQAKQALHSDVSFISYVFSYCIIIFTAMLFLTSLML